MTIFQKCLTNTVKCAAFLLTAISKKALVIRGVPTENYEEVFRMSDQITAIKRNLDDAITQLCEVSWMFSKCPEKDFTRGRKLPLRKMISLLLAME